MKIVLDTNLLISGIFWKGKPFQVLQLWADEKITLCASKEILDEYCKIIQRIQIKYGKNDDLGWTNFIKQKVELYEPDTEQKYSRDADDDKFIHCALEAKAVYIVSGDQDLLVLKQVENVEIVTVAEFLERYLKI